MRFPTKFTHYGYGWLDKIKQGYHPGIDYNYGKSYEDEGQDVVSICDGIVDYANYAQGWGHHVIIYHPDYKVYSHYAHLQSICVKEKEQVKEGQLVGPLGSTGGDWPPHLHFEIRLTNRPANAYVSGMTIEEVKQHYTNPEVWIEEQKKENNNIDINMLKLIKNINSKKVYAIGKDGKKHWILNQETFVTGKEIGLWTNEIEEVQDDGYAEGHVFVFVNKP